MQFGSPTTHNSSRYKSQELYSDVNIESVPAPKMDLAKERSTISHWARDDLEDKYLRLMDDHQVLKKHAKLQEMKIKKMSTKLLKLASDAKKNGDMTPKHEDSEDLRRKCSVFESQNSLLKDKLKLLQSQLLAQGKKPSVYDNVPPRINSGYVERSSSAQNSSRKNNIRVIKPRGELFSLSPRKEDHGHENQSHTELNKLVENLKYALHKEQVEKEEIIKKTYSREDLSPDHRSNVKDNLDLLRLGRDIKEKEVQINVMHAKYEDLKLKQQHLERNNREMSDEIDRLNNQLRSPGGDFGGTTEGHMRNVAVFRKRISDLEIMNNDFKKEIYLLKESNNRLTNDAFNTERERDWREKESNYRAKIAQLEVTLRRDVGEKGGVLNKLESERDKCDNAEKEMSNLRLRNYEMQAKIDELNEKLKYFSKDTSLNPNEIEEALIIIQQKRNLFHAQSTPELDFIEKVDRKKDQDLPRRLQESEMNHADTIQELEKTRSLLRTQYKITNDYRLEAEKISARLEELKKDYEDRLSEYARLLDIRAARIQKLEAQLKDIAYGTRNIQISTIIERDQDPLAPEILERGENLLEINIGRVCLTQQAIDTIRDKEPFLFGTWDFYDFETQATGVLRGTSSDFDIKAEYLIKIDDFFLNYLYKNTFSFELHQATGSEYVTLAACQLSCRDIFERTAEENKKVTGASTLKYHCKAKLIGLRDNGLDINFGVLEYWIRLKHPMDQVIRQYREKLKAEGYIVGNNMAITEASRPIESMNELIIRLIRCKGLKSRQKHLQPSSYLAYTFYDHSAHTTITIPSSNNPEFHDMKMFPLQMNVDLHQYLKSQHLQIYAFDDLDPDESVYLGVASIPMIQLCHNKNISGSFELYDTTRTPNGTLEVELEWQHSYLFQGDTFGSPMHSVALLPGEENIRDENQPSRQASPDKRKPKKPIEKLETKVPVSIVSTEDQLTETTVQPVKKQRQKKPTKENTIPDGLLSPPPVQIVKGILKNKNQSHPEKSLSDSLKDSDIIEKFYMPDVNIRIQSPVESSRSVTEEEIKALDSLSKSQELKSKLEAVAAKQGKPSIKSDDSTNTSNNIQDKTASSASVSNSNTDNSEKKKKKPSKKEKSKSSDSSVPLPASSVIVSENDDVVLDKKIKKKKLKPDSNPDEIVVEIVSVELEDGSDILLDDSIKFLFVEYRLPGISTELTETISLKKPSTNQEVKIMNYNFKKTFDVSFNNNYMIRQHIATMLTEESNKFIVFTLVQEPSEDSDSDCEDIGAAQINVQSILSNKKNLENERIPIFSTENKTKLIGYVTITIKIFGVLKAIEKELKKV